MKIRWNPRASAAESARSTLPAIVRAYLDKGRKTVRDKATARDLHSFRLATKKLRYTIEIFLPLYGPGLEARLKRIRAVQQALGELQDVRSTSRLAAVREHPAFMTWLRRQAALRKAAFVRVWQREFGGLNVERDWLSYLERYAKVEKD